MSNDNQFVELYRKYRPKSFKRIIGQPQAVAVMRGWIENSNTPHAILMSGASGCGKTTSARVLAQYLNCLPPNDLCEVNAADFTGIDTVREIRQSVCRPSLMGKEANRMWIIDECQQLSSHAQNGLLKLLEEAPAYAYFVLCTTDPQKLLATVKNRCSEVKFNKVAEDDLQVLVRDILENEGRTLSEDVVERLSMFADGSPRKCLVKLQQLLELSEEDSQLKSLEQDISFTVQIKDLCLFFTDRNKPKWADIAKVLKTLLSENDPETVRAAVAGWLSSALLGRWAYGVEEYRLANMLDFWTQPFYTGGNACVVNAAYHSFYKRQ